MFYVVMDWDDSPHVMTAKQLYECVKKDSERSSRCWLASASELTRVTGRPFFNVNYEIAIRAMILDCFSSIEHQGNCGGDYRSPCKADRTAVQECYNSLRGIENNVTAEAATKRYLFEMVAAATRAEDLFDFVAHPGPKFRDFCDEWIESKYAEYYEKAYINFEEMHERLRQEWLEAKEEAEERGDFRADDAAARERFLSGFRLRPSKGV